MDESKVVYLKERHEWRNWLENHFQSEKEIWLIFPHKDSGKPRIIYNDAVEEALCFGWIDSIIKKHGSDASKQRFTPRNPKSGYSQQNKERMRWLYEHNMLHQNLRSIAEKIMAESFHFPEDILEEIRKDPLVWKNYQSYSAAYKRIRIAYIDTARERHELFAKRLVHFIEKTRKNKQIGYGGIEKYF